mgnify:CR=1 FL=1
MEGYFLLREYASYIKDDMIVRTDRHESKSDVEY